jgi:hypothetical protein
MRYQHEQIRAPPQAEPLPNDLRISRRERSTNV